MNNIYTNVQILDNHIPELCGWRLTYGLKIELRDGVYHIWDPTDDKHVTLIRGTGSCSWGWGSLLRPSKISLINNVAEIMYPLIGMAYGLVDKVKEKINAC